MRPLFLICFSIVWLFFSPLDGQIVYNEIDPPQTVLSGTGIEIDFNDDSIVDLLLWRDYYKLGAGCISTQSGDLFSLMPDDTAYLFFDSTGVLYTFDYLDTIKESINCFQSHYYCANQSVYECPFLIHHQIFWHDCNSSTSTITGLSREVKNKYIGFKIKILGRCHYGWINFSKKEGVDFKLRAYAYNTIPEEAIVIDDPFYTTIERKKTSGLNIYPNPARDIITIDNSGEECIIKIMDLDGRITHSQSYHISPVIIPVSSLANGIYILQVESDNGRFLEKFIKN